MKLEEKWTTSATPTHVSQLAGSNSHDKWRDKERGDRPSGEASRKGGRGAGSGSGSDRGCGDEQEEELVQQQVQVLRAEAEGMRKELAEQERLLAAYQRESEELLEKAKKVLYS